MDETAEDYRDKIRSQAKTRTARFREEQAKKGYKIITVYMSEETRGILTRVETEKELNRQGAMEHIVTTYDLGQKAKRTI